jgi:subtilisin family serine protease
VAATDNKDQLASFSNYGATTVELGAPGVYVDSTVRNNGYAYYSGTSMATPHVSGAAVLILSACSLSTDLLRTTILNTVDPVPALAGKTMTGGRLNVFSALNGCVAPPAAPTGLSATLVGSQVNLAWTDNSSNEFGFRIERATNGGAWTTIGTVAAKVTSYADGTIAPSTQYSYRVFAYNAAGDSISSNTVSTAGPLVITGLTANVAFPVVNGTPITFTATASGPGSLEYEFWLQNTASGQWSLLSGYSASGTVVWTPGTALQGSFVLEVWVRVVGTPVSYQLWRDLSGIVIQALSVTSLTANVVFPVAQGIPITFTAVANNGTTAVEYEFWLQNLATGTWSLLQTYSTTATVPWNPGPTGVGNYVLEVWVRRVGSPASYQAWRDLSAISIVNVTVTGLSTTTVFPAPVGAPITFTATASAGTTPLEYAFFVQNTATGSWATVRNYAVGATVTWTPTQAGTYVVEVWVRAVGSTISFQASADLAGVVVQ